MFKNHFIVAADVRRLKIQYRFVGDQSLLTSAATISKHTLRTRHFRRILRLRLYEKPTRQSEFTGSIRNYFARICGHGKWIRNLSLPTQMAEVPTPLGAPCL